VTPPSFIVASVTIVALATFILYAATSRERAEAKKRATKRELAWALKNGFGKVHDNGDVILPQMVKDDLFTFRRREKVSVTRAQYARSRFAVYHCSEHNVVPDVVGTTSIILSSPGITGWEVGKLIEPVFGDHTLTVLRPLLDTVYADHKKRGTRDRWLIETTTAFASLVTERGKSVDTVVATLTGAPSVRVALYALQNDMPIEYATEVLL
jgi:hypothetical protein